MSPRTLFQRLLALWVLAGLCAPCAGCRHMRHKAQDQFPAANEFTRVSHPPYVVQPPDILLIDAVNLVPKPPYRIEPLDVLAIQVVDPVTKAPLLPKEPIAGFYNVTPEGTVDLGFNWKSVSLAGLTLEQARSAIEKHLSARVKGPFDTTVELAQSKAMQQIRGEHLVRPDGTVGLGTYGSVYVDGMTIAEARAAIEAHLANFLLNPQVSLDVAGYNSQVYYVIADLAGSGQQVYRLPVTGKETVLDAIALVSGLPPVSSKHHIWLARPTPAEAHGEIKLDVDWNGITQRGRTATNYQILPGDRVYVQGAPLVAADTYLGRIISPLERILGVGLLGRITTRAFESQNNGNSGIGGGF
ncbi:MAG: polysaccharide biosynthesis/export family protein [Gemmataceae bacterium]|nr:polysaccharide biosynthesis/export family protein [Gemmataceae bacterium]